MQARSSPDLLRYHKTRLCWPRENNRRGVRRVIPFAKYSIIRQEARRSVRVALKRCASFFFVHRAVNCFGRNTGRAEHRGEAYCMCDAGTECNRRAVARETPMRCDYQEVALVGVDGFFEFTLREVSRTNTNAPKVGVTINGNRFQIAEILLLDQVRQGIRCADLLEENAEADLIRSHRRRRYAEKRNAPLLAHAPEPFCDVTIRLRCAMMRLVDNHEVEGRAIPRLQAVASHRLYASDDNVTAFHIEERFLARCAVLGLLDLDVNARDESLDLIARLHD